MPDRGEDLSMRRRVASRLVGYELQRRSLLLFQDLAKEAFGGSLVAAAHDQNVEHIAVLVNSSPKVVTFAVNRDEHLVHVPSATQPPLSSP